MKVGLCLWVVVLLCSSYKIQDFQPALFHSSPPSGIYPIDVGSNTSGQALAFGNLNGDQFTDYIAVSASNPTTIQTYSWFQENSFIKQTFDLNLTALGTVSISQAMIVDFDVNGTNNIIFVLTKGNQYFIQFYTVSCSLVLCSFSYMDLNYSQFGPMTASPLLIDLYGNGKTAFVTFNNTNRFVVSFDAANGFSTQPFASVFTNNFASYNTVTNAFGTLIDVNGDCTADLIFLSQTGSGTTIEVYLKVGNGKYAIDKVLSISQTITWLGAIDLNGDGNSDLLYLAMSSPSATPLLYKILNQNKVTNICAQFPSSEFDASDASLVDIVSSYQFTKDSVITFGDLNFDSLPEIMSIFINPLSPSIKIASILLNKGSSSFINFNTINIDAVQQIPSPNQILGFDFTLSGRLDLMIISEQGQRTCLINNLIQDSLFIKILPMAVSSGGESGTYITAYGTTVQWRITDLDGEQTIKVLSQRTQWTFNSLPFTTVGLGRTNNYIEDLTVGGQAVGQTNTWTPIIPNSQLLVFEATWTLETILTDNARVYNVVQVSIIILAVLGLVIIFLTYRETQEDKRDQYVFLQMIK